MTLKATSAEMARLSVLPFEALQRHGLPSAYERSFKMARGRLLANRYLLGIPGEAPQPAVAAAIADHLGMPIALREPFLAELPAADGILLGFEAADDSAVFKLYLEFREPQRPSSSRPVARSAAGVGRLLHKGFKWRVGSSHQTRVTLYRAVDLPDAATLVARFARLGQGMSTGSALAAMVDGAMRAARKVASPHVTGESAYLLAGAPHGLRLSEVIEPGQAREGLDLNVYASGLTVAAIEPSLREAARMLTIDESMLERLMGLTRGCLLGHLAGGFDSAGDEYLSVYFEP